MDKEDDFGYGSIYKSDDSNGVAPIFSIFTLSEKTESEYSMGNSLHASNPMGSPRSVSSPNSCLTGLTESLSRKNCVLNVVSAPENMTKVPGVGLNSISIDKHELDKRLSLSMLNDMLKSMSRTVVEQSQRENEHKFRFELESCKESRKYNSDVKFSDFAEIEHLTDGTCSNIFKAICDDNVTIIKVIKDEISMIKDILEEFLNEALILSSLSHINIISIYGSGFMPSKTNAVDNRLMMALEPLDGGTLTFHLKRKRTFYELPFSNSRAIRIARELADALHYLHNNVNHDCVIIHRDLRPDNIGFTRDGMLKVMDFGLSIPVKRSERDVNDKFDLNRNIGGLIRYTAPEIALNEPYNEKVDMYSYGLILYEIMTGCLPYTAVYGGFRAFYSKVIVDGLRPGLDFDDFGRAVKVIQEIKDLIASCWDNESSNRPSAFEAAEMLTLLEYKRAEENENKPGWMKALSSISKKTDYI